jgi:hypothetical protein
MGYVNPRVDIAFKKIFGVEENKDLLMSLINAVVGPEDQVADLVLLSLPCRPCSPVSSPFSPLWRRAHTLHRFLYVTKYVKKSRKNIF